MCHVCLDSVRGCCYRHFSGTTSRISASTTESPAKKRSSITFTCRGLQSRQSGKADSKEGWRLVSLRNYGLPESDPCFSKRTPALQPLLGFARRSLVQNPKFRGQNLPKNGQNRGSNCPRQMRDSRIVANIEPVPPIHSPSSSRFSNLS